MAKLIWNRIEDDWKDSSKPEGYTYRAEVPGGWLISVWAGSDKKQPYGGGLTFYPDPEHKWRGLVDDAI